MAQEGKMSWVVADAFDYKGSLADRSKTGGWVPAALILGIEMCERLSTMGIAVNLVTYLIGTMHMPSATSANIVTDFMGSSFLLCLLGGFVADTFLGRFKTIAFSATIQVLGTGMLALSTMLPQLRPPKCDLTKLQTCQKANGFQMGVLYLALYLIALGTGGLKSSVSGFGSDQFDDKDEKERTQMTHFFSRFFFFISLGALMAVTVLVWIQDEVGRTWSYGICSVSMGIAIVVFLAGMKKYRYKKSKGSPIVHIFQVIVASIGKAKLSMPYDVSLLYEDAPEGSSIPHTDQFGCLDKAAIVTEDDFERSPDGSHVSNPWKLCSVTRVEEVKMMAALLPVWATTIMFWTTYAQIITFSVEQASTMERSIGSFQIPAGSLTVFFVAAILITLGFYDRVVMPLWKSWKGKPGTTIRSRSNVFGHGNWGGPRNGHHTMCYAFAKTKNFLDAALITLLTHFLPYIIFYTGFTNLQRIAIGLVLSTMGMAAAAIAEKKRLSVAQIVGRDTRTLPISVYLLIPQFFLVGAGEAFIYTGQLDFFITQSPKSMKTMSTGLFLTTLSLGFFVSSFLVSVIDNVTGSSRSPGWLADNINYGRLDYFYGLLAMLSFINFGVFMICALWYNPQMSRSNSKGSNANGSLEDKC